MRMYSPIVVSLLLIATILTTGCAGDNQAATVNQSGKLDSGFATLVVTPDRGFMGNEQVRQVVNKLNRDAGLLFVDDAQSKRYFDETAQQLIEQQPQTLLVLPLFLSSQHQNWQLAKNWLDQDLCDTLDCEFAKPFGQSVFAVETLAAGLSHTHGSAMENLLVVGNAPNDSTAVNVDLKRIAGWAAQDRGFSNIETFIWQDTGDDDQWDRQVEQLQTRIKQQPSQVVSYHFGRKLDGMMSLDGSLARVVGEAGATLHPVPITDTAMSTWIQREQNRAALNQNNIGVIVHAHGSDFHWNERMRRAVATLQDNYTVEFAFSMADQVSIDNALTRLQERDMKGAVLVRVFGRTDSFEPTILRMLGMDVESGQAPLKQMQSMMTMSHGHHGAGPQARIQSPLVITSVGGLEDHPLFARALLQRARELSTNPDNEEVILVAHGTGDEDANSRWLELLGNIAKQMQSEAEEKFAAIHYATWQEDWPEKREKWIAQVRGWVEQANNNGETVLVIPARTNATGPEQEFLQGLDFKLGEGFAGHPLFADWVESQIQLGMNQLL